MKEIVNCAQDSYTVLDNIGLKKISTLTFLEKKIFEKMFLMFETV